MPNNVMRPLILLHGWSDTSRSFEKLAQWLKNHGFNVVQIFLGDYLSMNDEITLFDLGDAFQRALTRNAIQTDRHSFDLVVHSTGGLVAREYIRQVCVDPSTGRRDPSRSPVLHLCMLAPANFGSPLSTVGKSVLGRLFKGWDWNHLFESGQRVLDALELAAPYSYQLALDDLFDPNFRIFAPENTFTTVMVGTIPYPDALRSSIHENGSDGTVRVSTANLNANFYLVDFPSETAPPSLTAKPLNVSDIAFAVVHRNHGSIIDPDADDPQGRWAETLLNALRLEPGDYSRHRERCAEITKATFAEGDASPNSEWYHRFQHVIFRVHDQHGAPITDYVIEFYQEHGDDDDVVFKEIHAEIIKKKTKNQLDGSYRSFLFDLTDLHGFLQERSQTEVRLSITAAAISRRISFRNPKSGFEVFTLTDNRFVHPNQPILVDITLYREPNTDSSDDAVNVFRLHQV